MSNIFNRESVNHNVTFILYKESVNDSVALNVNVFHTMKRIITYNILQKVIELSSCTLKIILTKAFYLFNIIHSLSFDLNLCATLSGSPFPVLFKMMLLHMHIKSINYCIVLN
jgi:hypothetical protein